MQSRLFGKLTWQYLNINQDFKDFQPPWNSRIHNWKQKGKNAYPPQKAPKQAVKYKIGSLTHTKEKHFSYPASACPPISALTHTGEKIWKGTSFESTLRRKLSGSTAGGQPSPTRIHQGWQVIRGHVKARSVSKQGSLHLCLNFHSTMSTAQEPSQDKVTAAAAAFCFCIKQCDQVMHMQFVFHLLSGERMRVAQQDVNVVLH